MLKFIRQWMPAAVAAAIVHIGLIGLWVGMLAVSQDDHGPRAIEPDSIAWVDLNQPGDSLQTPSADSPGLAEQATANPPDLPASNDPDALAGSVQSPAPDPSANQVSERNETGLAAEPVAEPVVPTQPVLADKPAQKLKKRSVESGKKAASGPPRHTDAQRDRSQANRQNVALQSTLPVTPRTARSDPDSHSATTPPLTAARTDQSIPARSAPTSAPPSAATDADIAAYAQLLLSQLLAHKSYPPLAKANGLEGVAELTFTVDRDGRVRSRSISRSSGHALLDRAALDLVDASGRFPPPPGDERQRVFRVPVAYGLR